MTSEETKILNEKIANNKATPEERLLFLKELNKNLGDLADDLGKLNDKVDLASIRNDLKK